MTSFFRPAFAAVVFALWSLALFSPAQAVETMAKHAILIDTSTGTILMEKDADTATAPASLSKIMMLYLIFERLAEGNLTMEDTFAVSEKAWRMGGSKMFVGVNTRVTIADLLRGVIVQSGNDASIVIAEGLGGTESNFAVEMTERAFELGLTNSVFKNATGWPEEGHVMSARDIATLAFRLITDFPQYYPIFAETSFTYNEIRQSNRNPLLYDFPGADGLKTGHTDASGYGLAASAVRNGRRLILVLNGLESVQDRAREAERLLDWGFREFANYTLFTEGEVVDNAEVWLGAQPTVPLVIQQDLILTLSRTARRNMTVKTVYQGPIPARIESGTELAKLVIEAPDTPSVELPLIAGADVDRLGVFGRLRAAVGFLVWGAVTQ
jgi:D-alanyl-D-alanine carboxypeptidase (penicillin-binding protein 5/6)